MPGPRFDGHLVLKMEVTVRISETWSPGMFRLLGSVVFENGASSFEASKPRGADPFEEGLP